jgi:hypothetical protein
MSIRKRGPRAVSEAELALASPLVQVAYGIAAAIAAMSGLS